MSISVNKKVDIIATCEKIIFCAEEIKREVEKTEPDLIVLHQDKALINTNNSDLENLILNS